MKIFRLIILYAILSSLCFSMTEKRNPFVFKGFDVQMINKNTREAKLSFETKIVIGGEMTVKFDIPSKVKNIQNNSIDTAVRLGNLSKTQILGHSINLKLPENGYFCINIEVTNHSINMENPSGKYFNRVIYPIYIEVKNGKINKTSFLNPDSEYTKAPKIVNKYPKKKKPVAIFNPKFSSNNNSKISIHNKTHTAKNAYEIQIYIAGRITYTNFGFGTKGIPDVAVRLDWDYDNDPSTGYTPYDGGNQLHVDYDVTDMNGNYYFSFVFNSSQPANYYSDKIRVYVSCANSATFDGDLGNGAYFTQYRDLDISNINDFVYFPSADIDQSDVYRGSALRYHHRSRLFSINQFGFTPNQIRYYIRLNKETSFFCEPGNCGGMNMTVPRIVYDQVPEDFGTAYHEYGHFIEYNKVGFIADQEWEDSHWFELETEHILAWNEGWAEFCAAATYNYWYKQEMPTNPESNSASNKYVWMDYSPSVLNPSTNHHEVEGAIACFLYNLWDGVELRSPYYTGDNDDLNYSGAFIINNLANRYNTLGELIGSTHIEAYKNALLNSLDSQNDASVNALYNWLILQSGGVKSAQPTNITVSGDYNSRTLNWEDKTCPNTYTWPAINIDLIENNEQGFKIYRNETSQEWDGTLDGYNLIKTVGANVTNWEDNDNITGHYSYVVTSYNNSGISIPKAEQNVYYPVITPVISSLTQSPNPICQGSIGYVYCNLSQGNGNLNYSWSASNLPSGASITPMGDKCKITYSYSKLAQKGSAAPGEIKAPVNEITCTVSNSAGSDTESRKSSPGRNKTVG